MIESFGDRETELVWNGEFSRRLPPPIQEPALTKLRLLNAAVRLENLVAVPGNRLESLNGERKGQLASRPFGRSNEYITEFLESTDLRRGSS